MSDTPETDRRIITQDPRMCGCGYKSEIVFADFARRLEHERNAAIAERDKFADALRKAILWGDSASHHIRHREDINWTYLNEAKEMVELQNKKTEKLLDNADKHSKMYP